MTMKPRQKFLFLGNGPYLNRGCEAIVRGTMEVLRREFTEVDALSGVFASREVVKKQNKHEIDPSITSYSLGGTGPRWSRSWWSMQARKRLRITPPSPVKAVKAQAAGAYAALEIGGDNYTFDYGGPERYMEIDKQLLLQKIPVVIWGASIGPFNGDVQRASEVFDHLRRVDAIFVRESASLKYLWANNVRKNVALVADPAFVMDAVEPRISTGTLRIPAGGMGINLSTLINSFRGRVGKLVDKRSFDFPSCVDTCCELVLSASNSLGLPIVLVPHVSSVNPMSNDFFLLESVRKALISKNGLDVDILPPTLNAAELKWVIGRLSIFVGARTHSTIAAISSCIPTLSIGYSLKAKGINHDVFGNLDYCLSVDELSGEQFAERLRAIYESRDAIRCQLAEKVKNLKESALRAGPMLRNVIDRS